MPDEAADDNDLVRRFQRGDSVAFETFAARHTDRLYRLALVWLNDAQRAEDATQEVFVRALHGMRRFRFGAQPFSWLYRTLRNVCHEFNRARRFEAYDDEQDGRTADTGRVVANADSARRVRKLVALLPPRQREVVVLRYFEACSVRETAALMRCREGTVKALMHKAMQKLKLSAAGLDPR